MTPVLAYCETCGREFYTASSARKFCDVPRCRGYLIHIDRGRNRARGGVSPSGKERDK